MTAGQIPGFVDLQVNGFEGVDFSSGELAEESFTLAASSLLRRGTAAFLPTIITCPRALLLRNIGIINAAVEKNGEFAGRVLGFHLEGPFISPESGAVGAHPPDSVSTPDIKLFDELYDSSKGKIALMTVAAEVDGMDELVRHAVSKGVAVSCGHELAGPADMAKMAEAGATALTHLGNGMPNMVHRHNNPLLAGLAEERLKVMFIPDGHHLPRHVLKVFARAAGAGRLVATSDASPAAGLPPGEYDVLGNRAVLEPNGLLHNPDKQCLVGSSATLLECMNVLHKLEMFTLDELVKIGFENPLVLIGMGVADVAPALRGISFAEASGWTL